MALGVVVVAPANAAAEAVGPINPTTGFPAWYADENGTTLDLCLDDPNCLAGSTLSDLVAPTGEAFYYSAVADFAGDVSGFVWMATEAAFLDAGPGQEITFERNRIRLDVPVDGDYTVYTPYSEHTFTGVVAGIAGPDINFPDDHGCATVPCDFTVALGGRVGPFLRWDTGAPPGYLGDGITPHTVIGSNVPDVAVPGTFRNLVRVTGPAGSVTQNEFTVAGRLQAGPQAALSESALEFGNTASANRTLTVTNVGSGPTGLTLGAPSGLGGGPFSVTSNRCTAPIASGASCTVVLGYASAVANPNATATLTMSANTPTGSISVPLHATSLPVASLAGGPLAFGAQKVGTTSAAQSVTLTNTGVVPMNVGDAAATGPFNSSDTCGATLAAGASCPASATYTASARGAQSGNMTIAHPGASGPTSVALTGSGTSPTAALSTASLEFGSVQIGTTSPQKTVRLTNTGDAVMVVGTASLTGRYAVASSDCPAALSPAGFCTVAVTFRPTSLGDAIGTLRLPNDASPGGAALVALHGTGAAVPVPAALLPGVTPPAPLVAAVVPPVVVPPVVAPPVVVPPAAVPPKVLLPKLVPGAPVIGLARSGRLGGVATAKARWVRPASTGGAGITGYRVLAQQVEAGQVIGVTRSGLVAPDRRGLRMSLAPGSYRFKVKAVNEVGLSPFSARSNRVTAR